MRWHSHFCASLLEMLETTRHELQTDVWVSPRGSTRECATKGEPSIKKNPVESQFCWDSINKVQRSASPKIGCSSGQNDWMKSSKVFHYLIWFQSKINISSFSTDTNLSSQDSSGSSHLLDRSRQHGCSHSAPDTPARRCHPGNNKSHCYASKLAQDDNWNHNSTIFFSRTVDTKTHGAGLVTVFSSPPWRTCADPIDRVTCSSIRT